MIDLKNLESSIVAIYHEHYLDVYRFLVCFSGNQNDAEDMTQEVFIQVLKSLHNFQSGNNLKTWIFSIAKHVAVDHYRKKKFASVFKDGFFKLLESNDHTPDEALVTSEMKQLVHGAVLYVGQNRASH